MNNHLNINPRVPVLSGIKGLMACAIIMLSIITFSSCERHKWEEFEPVELSFEGAEVEYDGFIDYEAHISAQGGTVTITSDGKYKDYGYLSQMFIRMGNGQPPIYEWDGGTKVCPDDMMPTGDWGEAHYISETIPYSISLKINPNTDSVTRHFDLDFGCCYSVSHLRITQSAQSPD